MSASPSGKRKHACTESCASIKHDEAKSVSTTTNSSAHERSYYR